MRYLWATICDWLSAFVSLDITKDRLMNLREQVSLQADLRRDLERDVARLKARIDWVTYVYSRNALEIADLRGRLHAMGTAAIKLGGKTHG